MHKTIKFLYSRFEGLLAENKLLQQHIQASRRYNPTPFERETVSPEEKARGHQMVLDQIGRDFKKIQMVVDNSVPPTFSPHTFIASFGKTDMKIPERRTFLNIVSDLFPFSFRTAPTMSQEMPPHFAKTVIWDSGSSMSITNDKSEYIEDRKSVV